MKECSKQVLPLVLKVSGQVVQTLESHCLYLPASAASASTEKQYTFWDSTVWQSFSGNCSIPTIEAKETGISLYQLLLGGGRLASSWLAQLKPRPETWQCWASQDQGYHRRPPAGRATTPTDPVGPAAESSRWFQWRWTWQNYGTETETKLRWLTKSNVVLAT